MSPWEHFKYLNSISLHGFTIYLTGPSLLNTYRSSSFTNLNIASLLDMFWGRQFLACVLNSGSWLVWTNDLLWSLLTLAGSGQWMALSLQCCLQFLVFLAQMPPHFSKWPELPRVPSLATFPSSHLCRLRTARNLGLASLWFLCDTSQFPDFYKPFWNHPNSI